MVFLSFIPLKKEHLKQSIGLIFDSVLANKKYWKCVGNLSITPVYTFKQVNDVRKTKSIKKKHHL